MIRSLVSAVLLIAASASFAFAQALKTGLFRGEITDPAKGDVIMKCAVHAPAKLPEQKTLALLILFHGFRGNENNYIGRTIESLKKTGLIDRYVVVSGKSKGPGWTTDDDEPVLRIIDWAGKTYPIDKRRVFIFGSSNGAAYLGRFGWEHQDILAGAVGYCGGYKFAKPIVVDKPAEKALEWYFVHGSKDNPKNSRRAADELEKKGYRTIFRQMDGYGHTDIWDSGGHPNTKDADAVREDWLQWTYALRHKVIAPSDAEKKTLIAAAAKLNKGPLAEVKDLLAEVARIGGPPAASAIRGALGSADADVRAAAAVTCETTFYSPTVIEKLTTMLRDESEPVRRAAIRGLGSAAVWRYANAQKALCDVARAAARPEGDRTAAIAALGRTVKTVLLGNFEDELPVWTLVRLLEDGNSAVRMAAFAALKDGTADTFGYNTEGAEDDRKAAAAKWREWCTKAAGPEPGAAARN
jgi:predicted esterase